MEESDLGNCVMKATVNNPLGDGLDGALSMSVAEVAKRFKSNIWIAPREDDDDGDTNAALNSVMQLVILGAVNGTRLYITAEGEDAEAACVAIKALLENTV